MKAGNTASFVNDFVYIIIIILSIFLDNSTSGNIVDILGLLSICDHAMLCWIKLFLVASHFIYKAFKFFMLKDVSQVRVLDNSLLVANQLNIGCIHREIIHLTIDLCFHLICFFIFNLSMLKHFLNCTVFVNQKVVLGSAELDGLADFGKHFFNIGDHVLFCLHALFLALF